MERLIERRTDRRGNLVGWTFDDGRVSREDARWPALVTRDLAQERHEGGMVMVSRGDAETQRERLSAFLRVSA